LLQPSPVVVSQAEEDLAYVAATKCKLCHNKASTGKFLDDWQESKHAKAFDLLKGDEQKNPECLQCHTTGFGKKGGFVSLEETKEMVGVQCDMCHSPSELHIKSKKDDVVHHVGKVEEKRCQHCHNDKNPNWNPEKYTKADGTKTGFDYEQAFKKVNHSAIRENK
jgi:hypothetical protein